jgi:hypothetical protein
VKLLLVSAVVMCAVLSGSAQGASPAYQYDRGLGAVARESLWRAVTNGPAVARSKVRKVYVRCYRDQRTFEHAFERRFGLSANRVIAYYAGGSDVHLRNGTCDNVHSFLAGRHTVYTAAAYSILLHESLHRQGVKDERITTCLANDAVRWGALWFGFDEARALRARNLALTFTLLYSPPAYRMGKPNCLLLNRRTDWTDHRVADER